MIDPTQAAAPAAPMDAAPQDAAPDMSAGFTIEIRCTPDGRFAIGVEPMAAEAQEDGGAGAVGASDDFQAVGSLGEALKLVREIATHAGQMTDPAADVSAMSAGYGSNT